jgi:hypothetical protein
MIIISEEVAASIFRKLSLKSEAEDSTKTIVVSYQTPHIPSQKTVNLEVSNFLGIFMRSNGCSGIISAFGNFIIV